VYTPQIQLNAGGNSVQYLSGPLPAGPMVLAPWSTTIFVWTYSVTGVGTLAVTATATGTFIPTGAPLQVSTSAQVTLSPDAQLAAALAITPTPAAIGQMVQVALTVTNTGVGIATQVMPPLGVGSGNPLISVVSGPLPSGPLALAPGGATTFTWTFSVTGVGTLILTATVTGVDSASGTALTASGTAAATLVAPAQLVATIALPAGPVTVGDPVVTVLTVRNIGLLHAVTPGVGLALSGSGQLSLVAGPAVGATVLAGGASEKFTWTYVAAAAGTVQVAAQVSATSAYDGTALTAGATGSLVVSPAVSVYTGPVRVFPNPFNPALAIRGAVKFEGVPQGAALRLYTSSGQKVWSAVSSGGGAIEWDGRNSAGSRVAPGVYWWVVESQGTKQRGKLVIE
jgi:hypothetical protein